MKHIKNFTKQNLDLVRKELNKVLKGLETSMGIKIEVGHISFNDESFTAKFEAVIINKLNLNLSGEEIKWKKALNILFYLYNVDSKDYDKIFNSPELGKVKFMGIRRSAPKYSYVFKTLKTNKIYFLTKKHVNNLGLIKDDLPIDYEFVN